ncbi:MAG: hypothetical protein AAF891_06620 [Pseudomonadota bacterium]
MRTPKGDALDPKGLIAEAYRIDGITGEECRSIFLDWALSYDGDARVAIPELIARHGQDLHPMTAVLQEGQQAAARPRRRGGWRVRDRG